MKAYDYIVIGAGAAGCVLANRLRADANHCVCLIEDGGNTDSPLVRIPTGVFAKTRYAEDDADIQFRWQRKPYPAAALN